ncbi:LOW QUALITY PROTEIN: gelsolin-like protein 2 [Amphiura filiformis]|uniref:LOW QUALITY PROTEIN: gelsolin-like protein 2 n=1 Tax=Amphiura filiformis TaxID=82378 RepID=UPI003B223653
MERCWYSGRYPNMAYCQFEVTHWPVEHYGYFYNGDSYIVLNTFKDPGSGELLYDVHLWIGLESTPDEYGTAKYKTDELCVLLQNKPVQHREVMDHESALFRSYFHTIRKLEGGADSGFNRTKPSEPEYKTRLFHFKGSGRKIEVREVALNKQSLDDSDVFILDAGLNIIQWNGTTSNAFEKNAGRDFLGKLKSERNGKATTETVDAPVPDDHPFMKALPGGALEIETEEEDKSPPSMHRVSDATGTMEFRQIAVGKLSRSKLDTDDVFVVDTTKELFVWIGRGASIDERRNSLTYAHNYLMATSHPFIPVTVVQEGAETKNLLAALT